MIHRLVCKENKGNAHNKYTLSKLIRWGGLGTIGLFCSSNNPSHSCSDTLTIHKHIWSSDLPRESTRSLKTESMLVLVLRNHTAEDVADYLGLHCFLDGEWGKFNPTAKSCLFAQIRMGKSSRSVFDAKSPIHNGI